MTIFQDFSEGDGHDEPFFYIAINMERDFLRRFESMCSKDEDSGFGENFEKWTKR